MDKNEENLKLKFPHANAFVDLNTDGNSDLFVTNEKNLELWENEGSSGQGLSFRKHKTVEFPKCDDSQGACVGQVSSKKLILW